MTERLLAVVTGATGGIGYETARGLVSAGYAVVMVGRTAERAAAAAARLQAETADATISWEAADFAGLADVDRLAVRLRDDYPRIDLLVNNAGIFTNERRSSADGYELTFAVNYLAPFLLTTRLLDALRRAPAAHVINVGSQVQRLGRVQLDQISDPPRFSGFAAYANSKRALLLFTERLAQRLAPGGGRANYLHPGFVNTAINDRTDGLTGRVMRVLQRFAVTPAAGAVPGLRLATAPEFAVLNGAYLNERRVRPITLTSADQRLADDLWRAGQQWCAAALIGALG